MKLPQLHNYRWLHDGTYPKHTSIRNLQISGTNQGILFVPSTTTGNDIIYTTIEDVESGTYSAGIAVMPPSSSGSEVGGIVVVGGWYYQTAGSSYTNGGLYFDTGGGGPGQLDGVKLLGVNSFNWRGSCAEFHGGQNFEIVGGTYSGAIAGESGAVGCHVISGPIRNLSCRGADLSSTYTAKSLVAGAAQPYALVVSGNPTNVWYDRCTMLGYTVNPSPVSVTGSPTNLRITNCPGYNDQNTPVSSTLPTSATSAASKGYYGPSEVNFSGGTGYTLP